MPARGHGGGGDVGGCIWRVRKMRNRWRTPLRESPEKGKSENGRINTGGFMVGLGGLEPPTSPLSGARSSHLSYRPQHRRGNVHNYLIVRWFSVFRNCAESALRYKTATFPIHSLCTLS